MKISPLAKAKIGYDQTSHGADSAADREQEEAAGTEQFYE